MEAGYPRVVDLTYRVVSASSHRYSETAELVGNHHGFRFKIADAVATFLPSAHFPSDADARAALEPPLRAWELDAELKHGIAALKFAFLAAHTEHSPPQPGVVTLRGVASMAVAEQLRMVVTYRSYPPPPLDFAIDDCVQDIAEQYSRATQAPHTLLKNAYAILARLNFEYGSHSKAADALGISSAVLKEVQKLASNRGTDAEVRKFTANVPRMPLTEQERSWIARVLEIIVRRTGAVAAKARRGELVTFDTTSAPQTIRPKSGS